ERAPCTIICSCPTNSGGSREDRRSRRQGLVGLRSHASLPIPRHPAKTCETCSNRSLRPPLRRSAHKQTIVMRWCRHWTLTHCAGRLPPICTRTARTGVVELLRPGGKQSARPSLELIVRRSRALGRKALTGNRGLGRDIVGTAINCVRHFEVRSIA